MGDPAQLYSHLKCATPRSRLRLLSYNIQVGVDTRRYREYLTHGWKHVLPYPERALNLQRIARQLHLYDLVGLQEVDSGSLRSGFVDQTEYLAHAAGFPHWFAQINRNMGPLAQHSNGVLSRLRPSLIAEHRLPGLPGRGAIMVQFETSGAPLVVCIMHLALGRRARIRQMDYIGDVVRQFEHVVLMGDFNCGCDAPEFLRLIDRAALQGPSCREKNYPSWRPARRIDHILVSPTLRAENVRVLDVTHSDHRPITTEIALPETLELVA